MSSPDERIDALERQVDVLTREVAQLRAAARPAPNVSPRAEPSATAGSGFVDPRIAAALGAGPPKGPHSAPGPRPPGEHRSALFSSAELESFVGRYVVVGLAALIILMGVGAVIKMAVERGLLTPEVRIASGFVAAIVFAGAGFFFRQRGDVRYGGALLALSLAMIDVVAWGAGPHFKLIPPSVALAIIDVVAVLIAALALHDASEFLFVVAVGGALSAPFVASEGGGTAPLLLLYGFAVLASTLRAARDPAWWRAFGVLAGGALLYECTAATLPGGEGWFAPYALLLFPGALAVTALLLGVRWWKSDLSRAYLASALLGVVTGWDTLGSRPYSITAGIAVGLALVTYIALAEREVPARLWTASALFLPLISSGLAYVALGRRELEGGVFALWSAFAMGASYFERRREENERAGTHVLAGAVLGGFAIAAWLWDNPLALVAGLSLWGVVVAMVGRDLPAVLPVCAVGIVVGAAALSALDQLVSRGAYSYVPFWTRSSASALAASVGIGIAGLILGKDSGRSKVVLNRAGRIGILAAFLILWGRMEFAFAFNRDLAAFLLSSYYAACGLGAIVAGRMLDVGRLRAAGLALSLYAAMKAVVEVTDISSVGLRVGAYAAVGVFLLGAGYLYRERREIPAGGPIPAP